MKPCRHCRKPFEPKRPHARFCSDACRAADWRQRVSEGSGERVRRPSRNGHGTRLYVTPIQIALLRVGVVPIGMRSKLAQAAQRIAA